MAFKCKINLPKDVTPHLYFSHRLNTKTVRFCFTVTFYGINFLAQKFQHRSSNISAQNVLGVVNAD